MNDTRTLIQSKLNEIKTIDAGPPIPDSVVEDGQTYFGYELQETHIGGDCDSNYVMQVNLIGRLVRRVNDSEDTLKIIDEALSEIKKKLKEIRFSYDYRDVTIDNNLRKIEVDAEATYNELNIK